jgi:hypothetical protein
MSSFPTQQDIPAADDPVAHRRHLDQAGCRTSRPMRATIS